MPAHGNIPRPRHLFPEVVAPWIQLRRGWLRLKWWTAEQFELIPVWSLGAASGLVGIMLAVTLFFLHTPAADATVTLELERQVIPKPEAEPEPTPAVPQTLFTDSSEMLPGSIASTARLENSMLTRVHLPRAWDQQELARAISEPAIPNPWELTQASVPDPWRITVARWTNTQSFTPYALGATVPVAPATVRSAVELSPHHVVDADQSVGLFVEKLMEPISAVGEPTTYRILVQNTTTQILRDVTVRERLSAIQRVSHVSPPAAQQGDELVWSLGSLDAGDIQSLSVTIVPSGNEDEIETLTHLSTTASIAARARVVPAHTVWEPAPEAVEPVTEDELLPMVPEPVPARRPAPYRFPAESSTAAPKSRPVLRLAVSPVTVLRQGETLSLIFTVTNVGTAVAEDVDLAVRLSDELEHRYGEHVAHHIVRLEPGASHAAVLRATASVSGDAQLGASLTMQGVEAESRELEFQIHPGTSSAAQRPLQGGARSTEIPSSREFFPSDRRLTTTQR